MAAHSSSTVSLGSGSDSIVSVPPGKGQHSPHSQGRWMVEDKWFQGGHLLHHCDRASQHSSSDRVTNIPAVVSYSDLLLMVTLFELAKKLWTCKLFELVDIPGTLTDQYLVPALLATTTTPPSSKPRGTTAVQTFPTLTRGTGGFVWRESPCGE